MIFDHFVGFSTSSNDLKLAVRLPGRVQTGTKEIRPEELWLKDSNVSGMWQK